MNIIGQRHGYGEISFENGDKYHGYWLNDKKNGKGSIFKLDGTIEHGFWENDSKKKQELID